MRTRRLRRLPPLLPLDARAAAGVVPGASRLPFIGGRGEAVPDVELVVEGVKVDQHHLERYRRVCGYRGEDHLPLTYPHVVAFPLHLMLLTHRDAPFRAAGLVHLENEIDCTRTIRRDEPLDLHVHLTGLEPHPRGQRFFIVTEVTASGEPLWTERSTIVRRLEEGRSPEGGANEQAGGSGEDEDDGPEVPLTERWQIPRSTGFHYAVASGDHNPIHVHRLPARISGLPGVVAPGMWTKARALAALEDRLPEAMTAKVEFRRPIVLPAEVGFGAREEGAGKGAGTKAEGGAREAEAAFERGSARTFAVRDPDTRKAYVAGTVRAA